MSEIQQLRFGLLQRLWKRIDHLVVIGNEREDNSWFIFDQRQLDLAVRDHRRTFTHEPSAIAIEVMHGLYPRSCQTIDVSTYQGSKAYGSRDQVWRHFVVITTYGWETAKSLGQLNLDLENLQATMKGRKDLPEIASIVARLDRLRQLPKHRRAAG